ncbi:coiled-coil domain-containing protein [Gluconobacter thailandicus]|uniref:Chromosome partition protein Smc n=1 Tax=Gluconobacter thailandicus TaxID=257438 RepID=A0AAP9JHZ8_GLUTH|nr:AAA family ATPase [Gluconobacter thailandicus]QEH96692.1 AAA family ATPase [Gluconobacter thailandicus]
MSTHTTTISRLTIGGFKSFADEVRVDILPGLTGIIGPNGCGKSNVVEGLRWAMGETSARALRGGELDDLIFAGTGARSARNIAQVTLHLTGAKGLAPAPFQEAEELEITRRAERGSGSEYRINGRVMRARDVQTLFADLASGARSSAIVSQNRVGQLIAAKPEERRLLLEEAAGITGLHARRHDAELKLRQTETNLSRAEDLRLQIEERLGSLEEQTVQARKYREISEKLREAEVQLHALLHARANLAVQRSKDDLAKAREALRKAEQEAEHATIAEFEARKATPQAREETDRLRSALERLKVQSETARVDVTRAREAEAEALARFQQAEADLARSTERLSQDQAAHATALTDLEAHEKEHAQLPEQRAQATEEQNQLATLERTQAASLEEAIRLRDAEAIRRDGLKSALDALTTRLDAETGALQALEAELAALEKDRPDDDVLENLRQQVDAAIREAEDARQTEADALSKLQDARLAMELQNRTLTEGRQRLNVLEKAEADLNRRLQAATARLTQDRAAHTQTATALLTDERRAELQAHREKTLQALEEISARERAARQALDEANTAWLEARAKAEEGVQRHKGLLRAKESAQQAATQAAQRAETALRDRDTTAKALVPESEVAVLRKAVTDLETRLNALQDNLSEAEKALISASEAESSSRDTLSHTESTLLRLRSECEGLEQTLATIAAQPDPLEDKLDIPADLARAVAAALADGLDASLAPETVAADRRWRALAAIDSPQIDSCPSLSSLVAAPEPVRRCLDAVFLLDDPARGGALQTHLQPGQALVCRNGALWRWDGFIRSGDAPDAGATRLEQRQRLMEARALLAEQDKGFPAVQSAFQEAQRTRLEAEQTLQRLRSERSGLEPELSKARTQFSAREQQAALAKSRWEEAERRLADAETAAKNTRLDAEKAAADYDAHPSPAALTDSAEQAAQIVEAARTALTALTRDLQTARTKAEQADRSLDQAVLRHETAQTRLQELEDALKRLERDIDALQTELEATKTATDRPDLPDLERREAAARQQHHEARQKLETASKTTANLRQRADQLSSELQTLDQSATTALARRTALAPRAAELRALVEKLTKEHQAQESAIAERPDPALLERKVLEGTTELEETRKALQTVRETLSHLALEDMRLNGSIAALRGRLSDLQGQISLATQSHAELQERRNTLENAWNKAAHSPVRLEAALKQQDLDLEKVQTAYDEARARDEATDQAGQAAQERRRDADLALSSAREAIARLTERAEQAVAARERLLTESDPPEGGVYPSDLSEQAETSTRRRLARLTRERDDLGAVNLRAETEYQDAKQTAETIAREHEELTAAINRLRGGIGTINREGRERLLAVFTEVDRHFQSLFSRMFGGGRAHLGMVGSDDPLEAGLEIFAQPPGKKLSTLSLLSGGEQALTALSLIFATFRCNPAPICVLDEVDAPLDDANVERFCSLLADMTKEAGTRFLVVTHHQLTMAHMDRLYGVTMQERGVSRVLSVDLGRAAALVEG